MKIRHTNILRTILKTLIVAMFLVFFIFIAIDTGSAVGEINVVIVYSKALAPYNDAISGFKDEFKAGNYLIDCTRYDLSSAQGKEEQFVNKIRNTNPTIIIAMGTEAALFSKLNFPDTTVIFSMVLNPVESGIAKNLKEPGKNITGVSLNIPIEDQIKFWLYFSDMTVSTLGGVLNYAGMHGGGSPIMEQIAITSQYDIEERKNVVKKLSGMS